jgi:hypothetical protein
MPITRAVVDMIHNGREPERAVQDLMSRAPKSESGYLRKLANEQRSSGR